LNDRIGEIRIIVERAKRWAISQETAFCGNPAEPPLIHQISQHHNVELNHQFSKGLMFEIKQIQVSKNSTGNLPNQIQHTNSFNREISQNTIANASAAPLLSSFPTFKQRSKEAASFQLQSCPRFKTAMSSSLSFKYSSL
jgi:hypothetical protein